MLARSRHFHNGRQRDPTTTAHQNDINIAACIDAGCESSSNERCVSITRSLGTKWQCDGYLEHTILTFGLG